MSAAVRALPLPDPEPAPDRERRAEVIELWRHRPHQSNGARRGINGHHPDCPYPATDVEFCSVCQGIRKGGGTA